MVTSVQWTRHFKILGKLIAVDVLAESQSDALEEFMVNAYDQGTGATGESMSEYSTLVYVLAPFATKLNSTDSSLASLRQSSYTYATTYFTTVIAADLGLTTPATVAVVSASLNTDWDAVGIYAPSGVSASGFYTWVSDNVGITLPCVSGVSKTEMDDAWVTVSPI